MMASRTPSAVIAAPNSRRGRAVPERRQTIGLARPSRPGPTVSVLAVLALAGAGPTPGAAEPAAAPVQVIDQQLQQTQLQQTREHLRPAACGELELVRRTCGSLGKESRAPILGAAEAGLTRAAKRFLDRQRGGQDVPGFDVRREIHDAIAPVLEPLVPAAEFAAYQREHAARLARRARTARLRIIAKVTATLDLSAAQAEAIEAELQQRWQPAWLVELDDSGMMTNGLPLAPDFAADAIRPHLDERQQAAWNDWCRQAARSRVRFISGWNGRSLEPDPWWQP
jgi:hypothetical protein